MIKIEFPLYSTNAAGVENLLHDFMRDHAFTLHNRNTDGVTIEYDFESARHDYVDDLVEANQHEESFVGGDLVFQKDELIDMVKSRSDAVLSFTFIPWTEDDLAGHKESTVEVVDNSTDDKPDDWKSDLASILKILDGDEK